MVACTQPLAAEIGLGVLKAGGNAVDAAVAVAAAMNVTEPCSTGIGGDCFCLYYEAASGKVHALNGSGRAPAGLTLARAQADTGASGGYLPLDHVHAITVPGAAAGWVDCVEMWGTWPLARVLQPAIALAKEGFPVSPVTAYSWDRGVPLLQRSVNAGELLTPAGVAPVAGEVFMNANLAATFEALATEGKAGFYQGRVAEAIVAEVSSQGGVLSLDDLRSHESTFPEPISTSYRGVDVYEVPPNGQGITALIALNILEGFDVGSLPESSAERVHLQVESLRLAFADTRWYVADPAVVHVPTEELLSKGYAATRRALVDPSRAVEVDKGEPFAGTDTVSFSVVDPQGNAVSFINSNYTGFGSGRIPKGCGFSLQNRGGNFSMDPAHPNVLAGGKRPYHTIIPGLALQAGKLFATFSVMGGFMQPQGHLQILSNMIDFRMNPQSALDAPRFNILTSGVVALEDGFSDDVVEAMKRRGHDVVVVSGAGPARVSSEAFCGRGQIIWQDPTSGVLWAGSDGRGDGCAMGW